MGRVSTHVLDTAHGTPAKGVTVELHRLHNGERQHLKTMVTNADGRTDAPMLVGERLETGVYELTFRAGDYLRSAGGPLADPPFLDEVVVRFGLPEPEGTFHVPLVLAPFGYTTFWG